MEDYDQQIKDVLQALSDEERQVMREVIKLEQDNMQTLHEALDDSLVKEIVKTVEKTVK